MRRLFSLSLLTYVLLLTFTGSFLYAATTKNSQFKLTVEPLDCVLWALDNGSSQIETIDPANCIPIIEENPDTQQNPEADIVVTGFPDFDQAPVRIRDGIEARFFSSAQLTELNEQENISQDIEINLADPKITLTISGVFIAASIALFDWAFFEFAAIKALKKMLSKAAAILAFWR